MRRLSVGECDTKENIIRAVKVALEVFIEAKWSGNETLIVELDSLLGRLEAVGISLKPSLEMELYMIVSAAFFFLLSLKCNAANSNLFREYIGAESDSIKFSDVPISSGVEFHFILAFAIDYTHDYHPSPSNGKFNVFWETKNLGPCQVSSLKDSSSNVKIAVSLGGDSVGKGLAETTSVPLEATAMAKYPLPLFLLFTITTYILDYWLSMHLMDWSASLLDATLELAGELDRMLYWDGTRGLRDAATHDPVDNDPRPLKNESPENKR
ncbi:hypothetical protein V6N13_039611 [Hibiscus sabdariffa]